MPDSWKESKQFSEIIHVCCAGNRAFPGIVSKAPCSSSIPSICSSVSSRLSWFLWVSVVGERKMSDSWKESKQFSEIIRASSASMF